MAFYYVKAGGTAIGDAGRSATARTGSFASMGVSAYYDNLKYIYTDGVTNSVTAVATDDIVRSSHLHDFDYAVTTTIGITSSNVQSVDDANSNQYKAGARERTSAGQINIFSGSQTDVATSGISFDSIGGLLGDFIASGSNLNVQCTDIDMSSDGGGRQFRIDSSGVYRFKGGNYDAGTGSTTGGLLIRSGCNVFFDEFVFTGGTFIGSESNSGANIAVTNSDLSALGANPFINVGAAIADGAHEILLTRCKLPTITQILETGQTNPKIFIDMYQCTDFFNGAEGMFFDYHYSFYGESHTNTVTYLNYKYDGTNGASTKMESSANTSIQKPMSITLCNIPAQDLATTDTTYRIQLLLDTDTVASLSDTELWVEVTHNDNTSQSLGVIVSSRASDILSAGTALTTSSETWGGALPTNTQAYLIDVLLTSASLSNVTDGYIVVALFLALNNADVYADPSVQIGT